MKLKFKLFVICLVVVVIFIVVGVFVNVEVFDFYVMERGMM